jgi:predicted NBD/HSP70 family sugar kinase
MTKRKSASPAEAMRAFDSLPKPLRQAIASAAFVYDPNEIAARIAKGRRPQTILRGIVRFEGRAAQ